MTNIFEDRTDEPIRNLAIPKKTKFDVESRLEKT